MSEVFGYVTNVRGDPVIGIVIPHEIDDCPTFFGQFDVLFQSESSCNFFIPILWIDQITFFVSRNQQIICCHGHSSFGLIT